MTLRQLIDRYGINRGSDGLPRIGGDGPIVLTSTPKNPPAPLTTAATDDTERNRPA
ncbi:hypothetical protein [Actinomadura miaoliensis]|uniref:Uncharacterized protein n=1 Tax=Actinomadura miaoliensis TaxID=430685 RepID=A0ABP7WBA8_9ACTN